MENLEVYISDAQKVKEQLLEEIFYRPEGLESRRPDRSELEVDVEVFPHSYREHFTFFTTVKPRPHEVAWHGYGTKSFGLRLGSEYVQKMERHFLAITEKRGPQRITTALNLNTLAYTEEGRVKYPLAGLLRAHGHKVDLVGLLQSVGSDSDILKLCTPDEFLLKMHELVVKTVHTFNRNLGFSPQDHTFIHFS